MHRKVISWGIVLWCVISVEAFTNSKAAHIPDTEKGNTNPDLVGYTATKDTPNFHFRRLGTTSAATEFAQVSVDFDLLKLTTHINAISTTVQEAAIRTQEDNGLDIHMFQQLNSELRMLRERVSYIHHLVGSNHHTNLKHRSKRFVFTICLLYTSPSPRDKRQSRMPSSA